MLVATVSPAWFGPESVLGGGERYPENVSRAVIAAGRGDVRVDLVSLGTPAATTELEPGLRRVLLEVDLPGPVHADDALSWRIAEALEGADLVHVHQAFTRFGLAAYLAACVLGIPAVGSDHGGPTLTLRTRAEMRRALDAVVAYSAFGATDAGATDTVAGGVDADRFTPPTSPVGRSGFVYVGRILPHKGVEDAIVALPDGHRLTVAGRAPDARYLADLHELAEGRDVRFEHDASDARLLELYRSSYAVVLLSRFVDRYGNRYAAPELMGLTMLEAMCCATPAIVSDVAALPEFVDQGRTGFVADGVEATRAAMLAVAEPGVADRMGADARAAVVGRWDLASVGERMLDVYRRVLEERS